MCGASHLGFIILIIKSNFDIWNSCFSSLIDYIEEIHPLLFWLQHGREGRWLIQRLRLPLGPRRSTGLIGLASWPDGCITGAVLVRTTGLAALAAWSPSTLPSWTHEDTSVQGRSGIHFQPGSVMFKTSRHHLSPSNPLPTPGGIWIN